MDLVLLLKAAIAISPVLVLLFVFDRLDVFDLITFRTIALLFLLGGGMAVASLAANAGALQGFPIGYDRYSRYIAPIVEEIAKAAPILYLFATNRLGYKLDSAIAGFAVGAGFSVVENAWFLYSLGDANLTAWVVRGFGTAVMHGGATALFAVISHEFTEYQAAATAARYRFNPLAFLPGLAAAMLLHGAFNQFPDQPVTAMAMTLLVIPMTLFFVFARGDLATRRWLKEDHDRHVRVLEDLRSGRFAASEEGRLLREAASTHPKATVADMFAYAEVSTEIVLRAEAALLTARDAKIEDVRSLDLFDDLASLERKLGGTAAASVQRLAGITRNDLWELRRYRDAVNRKRR